MPTPFQLTFPPPISHPLSLFIPALGRPGREVQGRFLLSLHSTPPGVPSATAAHSASLDASLDKRKFKHQLAVIREDWGFGAFGGPAPWPWEQARVFTKRHCLRPLEMAEVEVEVEADSKASSISPLLLQVHFATYLELLLPLDHPRSEHWAGITPSDELWGQGLRTRQGFFAKLEKEKGIEMPKAVRSRRGNLRPKA